MEKPGFLYSNLTRLLLIFEFVFASVALSSTAPNSSTDQSALLAFKSDYITHDPLGILAQNWSTNTAICRWIGVSCSTRHPQRVTALNLPNMGLKGTIPPHLGNLSFLSYFNLSNNYFHGVLPTELTRLNRLKVIDFTGNNFSGDVPSWFGNLTSLQYMLLADNGFTGFFPVSLSNLSGLESLNLRSNFLTGNIPKEIGNLRRLKELRLTNNGFSGSVPESVFNLSDIVWINLFNNSLSGSLPEELCRQCRSLRTLVLSYNKFTGVIPRGIWNLTSLNKLSIGYNNFNGDEIPKEISNLQSLERLDLGEAGLSGYIRSSSFNISTLEALYLGGNKLFGTLPMDMCSGLSRLKLLSVYRNILTGSIPRDIGNCTSLMGLSFSENKLSGSIPSEIGNLLNMETMALSINNLTGTIPATIFNMSQLRQFSLGHNRISGTLPSDIGLRLPRIEGLYLGRNNLGGTIPDSISNASSLTQLMLYNNTFTGPIPYSLGRLGLLERLYLWGNNLTNDHHSSSASELSFLTSLTNCRRLKELWIALNPLNGILPSTIGNLSSSMERLDARFSGIKGTIPSEIGNLSNLLALSLGGNDFIGSIPVPVVKGLPNVQVLDFSYNILHGSVPVDLCSLRYLTYLILDQNKLSGPLPECLGNITSLRYLHIRSNRLTSNIPKSLFDIKDLLVLDLPSNSLTGNLPSEFESLTNAILVDLSMNQFSGEIPSKIGGIQSLINLYLDHNKFNGSIPESFGSMINLEFLDLSHNNLTGVIPKSLEALLQLKYFNVSFNRLSGEIPSGGPFGNFTSNSFMSNEALCGAPTLHVPLCHTGSPHQSRKRRLLLVAYVSLPIASVVFVVAIAFAFIRCRRGKEIPSQTEMSPVISHRRISYLELLQATNEFSESNLLGTGSFSSVYKGILGDGTILALKVFNLKLEGALRSFGTECEILRNLRHRNLTQVISNCSTPDFKGLLLEYMPNGTLEKWLHFDKCFLDISKRLEIMIDVACALEYLHHGYSVPVVHCDLKPSNVLLDDDMVAHVSDFGIAKLLCVGESIAQTKTIATIGYIAPEYGSEGLVSTKCDVYSYGIMLMETFTRTKPTDAMFDGDLSLKRWVDNSLPNGIAEIIDVDLTRPSEKHYASKIECISSVMELALQCAAESPEQRMNIIDVLAALKKIRLWYCTNCE